MKKNYWIILLLITSYSFSSCEQNEPNQIIQNDKIEGIYYKNEQFNLKIEIPENWYFMNRNQRTFIVRKNIESAIKEELQEEFTKVISEHTSLIFSVFKFPPDTIMEINPNMTITVTNISEFPDLKNTENAVEETITGIKEVSNLFEVQEGRTKLQINDKTFRGYKFKVINNGIMANYESFIGNYGDFNLQITISFKSEAEKKYLFDILNNIESI